MTTASKLLLRCILPRLARYQVFVEQWSAVGCCTIKLALASGVWFLIIFSLPLNIVRTGWIGVDRSYMKKKSGDYSCLISSNQKRFSTGRE